MWQLYWEAAHGMSGADGLGQVQDFADHCQDVRQYLTTLHHKFRQPPFSNDGRPPPTIIWKSAMAVCPHVVVDKFAKWFGPPAKAEQRIKYMSTARNRNLVQITKANHHKRAATTTNQNTIP